MPEASEAEPVYDNGCGAPWPDCWPPRRNSRSDRHLPILKFIPHDLAENRRAMAAKLLRNRIDTDASLAPALDFAAFNRSGSRCVSCAVPCMRQAIGIAARSQFKIERTLLHPMSKRFRDATSPASWKCDSDAPTWHDPSARSGVSWSGLRSPIGSDPYGLRGFSFESPSRHGYEGQGPTSLRGRRSVADDLVATCHSAASSFASACSRRAMTAGSFMKSVLRPGLRLRFT